MIVDGKVINDTEKEEKSEILDDEDGVVHYLHVIDILTGWTFTKPLEHIWKGLKADHSKISPVNPVEYGDRLFSFLQPFICGRDGDQGFL